MNETKPSTDLEAKDDHSQMSLGRHFETIVESNEVLKAFSQFHSLQQNNENP